MQQHIWNYQGGPLSPLCRKRQSNSISGLGTSGKVRDSRGIGGADPLVRRSPRSQIPSTNPAHTGYSSRTDAHFAQGGGSSPLAKNSLPRLEFRQQCRRSPAAVGKTSLSL